MQGRRTTRTPLHREGRWEVSPTAPGSDALHEVLRAEQTALNSPADHVGSGPHRTSLTSKKR